MIIIPYSILLDVVNHFQTQGKKGFEGFALLVGQKPEESSVIAVKGLLIPSYRTYQTEHGLFYDVPSEEILRVNEWLIDNQAIAVAQIHSHPTEAYHSEADDVGAFIDAPGGISIVVPNFGMDGINNLHGWAFYKLSDTGIWERMGPEKISNLITII